jgi:type I restriction enzyme, S subunit
VSILDEAFVAIDIAKVHAEQNLKNSKELFKSYLDAVFTNKIQDWKDKFLNEVCIIVNGGTPDTTIPEYWDGDNLWITPKDMGKLEDIYVYDTSRKITNAGLKNSSAKILPINSIILSSRAPIGHLAINKKPISTNQGCKGLIPRKDISTIFLFYFLKSSVELLNNLGTGATFRELSSSKLAEVIIPMPKTFNEQLTIVKKLDALSAETKKLEIIYQQKLNALEELKKSILQKAFNGEL